MMGFIASSHQRLVRRARPSNAWFTVAFATYSPTLLLYYSPTVPSWKMHFPVPRSPLTPPLWSPNPPDVPLKFSVSLDRYKVCKRMHSTITIGSRTSFLHNLANPPFPPSGHYTHPTTRNRLSFCQEQGLSSATLRAGSQPNRIPAGTPSRNANRHARQEGEERRGGVPLSLWRVWERVLGHLAGSPLPP